MIYLTYDEWEEDGFRVMAGEKSHKRNERGQAVFSEEQVEEDKLDLISEFGFEPQW